jgi:outer membrane biosynthesis protein TonB
MSDRNKNRRSLLADFFRYQQDQLSGKERNSFERELQKDNFASEAAEGFELVSGEDAMKDITDLQNRLKTRTAGRKRIIIYRVAASIAILMMISTLFIFIGRNNSVKKLADNSIQSQELKVTESQPLTEPARTENRGQIQPVKSMKKSDKAVSIQAEMKTATGAALSERSIPELNRSNDSVASVKVQPARLYASDEKRSLAAKSISKDKSQSFHNATGIILSSEDNQPLPGVNVHVKGTANGVITDLTGKFNINLPDSSNVTLIADYIGMIPKEFSPKADTKVEVKLDPSLSSLSEVIVTGYGSKRYDYADEEAIPGHTTPQPSIGKSEFDKYIKENLHRPDTLSTGQRVVVVVSFLVRKDGKIDSITIIRSPAKPFSDEAIRVLKSGPSWKPALDGNIKVEEEVRLRVVFK